jgi:glycosyltransferase involved in cell wall biosynthesis
MASRELWILDDARILGGGQLFALRLALYVLGERGAGAVRIACPGGSALANRATAAGVPVEDVTFPDPFNLPAVWRAGRRLRARMRTARTPLVIAGSARCQQVAVVAGLDESLVHLMHERDSAGRLSVRLVHRRRGRVVAVGAVAARAYGSDALRNFLLDADFDRLATAAPAPRSGVLAVLARLIPEKGVLELVRELKDAAGWRRLLVAGASQDERYAAAVEAAADERVELLGHVDDVTDVLGRADVVIVPSVGHEAQPTVIIEALAAGRPVVVREPILSADYDGLPVFAYGDLSTALRSAIAAQPPDAAVVRERFGAAQALAAIEGTA